MSRFEWEDFGNKAIRVEEGEYILIIDDITDSEYEPRYFARTFMAWGEQPYLHRDFHIEEGYTLDDAIEWAESIIPE